MIKQTKAYRAALIVLADAIAKQDPAEVTLLGQDIANDLDEVLEQRHPDYVAAMDAAYEEALQRRKRAGIEKRRATMRKRKGEAA